jgi:enamine deaminase RidA (YjgF/YER057c/UK114 family)
MSGPQYFVTPGYGETFASERHYSQAVRVGDRIDISGQGGWDDDLNFPDELEDEIVQAFDNVERTLTEAGVGWQHVIAIESYHVPAEEDSIGEAHNRVMIEQLRLRMGDHQPIWTELGVVALGAPGMRIEIRVTAIAGQGD